MLGILIMMFFVIDNDGYWMPFFVLCGILSHCVRSHSISIFGITEGTHEGDWSHGGDTPKKGGSDGNFEKDFRQGQRPVRSMARAGGNGGPCWSISKDKETQMHNLIRTSRGLILIIEREDFTFMSRLFHNNLIHTILTIKIVKISVFHNNLID